MRILLDTNILIQRENNHVIPENLACLMSLLSGLENLSIHIHPLSKFEIKKDMNIERREINLSKLSAYSELTEYPDIERDDEFKAQLPNPKNQNDIIDNQLLYCVVRNVTDYLITEDQGILNKADILGIESILNINEAIKAFEKLYPNPNITLINTFKTEKGFNLNLKDEIFDSLRAEYSGFDSWWNKKVANRDVFISLDGNNCIKALLVPKIEDSNEVDCVPRFKFNKTLKICTFKVATSARGLKLGERLLKIAIDYAILNEVDSIYLTHFTDTNDYLVNLIENFGFYKHGKNSNKEDVFVKELINNPEKRYSLQEANKMFYPSFYDGVGVKKHLVPIMPIFHKKLFPELNYQLSLFQLEQSEGNCIKKAYICNANTTRISKGDILLFYQSQEKMAVTTLGTVDAVYYNQRNAENIFKLIAKRTVYVLSDIEALCNQDVLVILFNENFHLTNEVPLSELWDNNILGNIISIREITHKQYQKIVEGNIDERFIIH